MRKRSIIIIIVIAVSAIAIIGTVVMRENSDPAVQSPPADPQPSPTATRTDPAEVFQKAFWKRPTDADKILHAERREWADAGDIRKWEWFLVVEPSPALLKYLIAENAFNLPACPTPPPPTGAPAWFAYDPSQLETIGATRAGLRFSFQKTTGRLYATDRGGGFQPGTPETPPPASAARPDTGRLPVTPPPDPRKP